jgi:hypothetical protein
MPLISRMLHRLRSPGLRSQHGFPQNQLLVATDLNVSLTAELKSQNTAEGGITLGANGRSPTRSPRSAAQS